MSSNNDDTNLFECLGVQGMTLKSSPKIVRRPVAVLSILLSGGIKVSNLETITWQQRSFSFDLRPNVFK